MSIWKKADYLCSGLVYCSCGAKMHGSSPVRKGHTYKIYSCSNKCGFGNVKMDEIDAAAIQYLKTLLSPDNQKRIALALRQYQAGEYDRVKDFNAAIKKRVEDKQNQYDALMNNLSGGALPSEVIANIGERMKALKDEIDALKGAKPPHDYTVEPIEIWLNSLKMRPARRKSIFSLSA